MSNSEFRREGKVAPPCEGGEGRGEERERTVVCDRRVKDCDISRLQRPASTLELCSDRDSRGSCPDDDDLESFGRNEGRSGERARGGRTREAESEHVERMDEKELGRESRFLYPSSIRN